MRGFFSDFEFRQVRYRLSNVSSMSDMDDEDEMEAFREMEEQERRAAAQSWTHSNLYSDAPVHDDEELEALRMMEEDEMRQAEKNVTGGLFFIKASAHTDPNLLEIFQSNPIQAQRGDPMFKAPVAVSEEQLGDNMAQSSPPPNANEAKAIAAKWGQGYSSSPMACTSPSFRCDQPTPIPSDWHIVSKKSSFPNSSPLKSAAPALAVSQSMLSTGSFPSSSPERQMDDPILSPRAHHSATKMGLLRPPLRPNYSDGSPKADRLATLSSALDRESLKSGSPSRARRLSISGAIDFDEDPLFSDDDEDVRSSRLAVGTFKPRGKLQKSMKSGLSSIQNETQRTVDSFLTLAYPSSDEEEETTDIIRRRRENKIGKKPLPGGVSLEDDSLQENFTLPETQPTRRSREHRINSLRLDSVSEGEDHEMLEAPLSGDEGEPISSPRNGRKRQHDEVVEGQEVRANTTTRTTSSRIYAEKKMRRQLDELRESVKVHAEIKKMLKAVDKKKDYSIMPTHTNLFVPCRNSDGERLFFPFKAPSETSDNDFLYAQNGMRRNLLETNIHVLMRQIDADRLREIEDSAAAREKMSAQGITFMEVDVDKIIKDVGATSAVPKLWVDKYAPKEYIDLVGDERINREVLSWVKQWDFCVFKKAVKIKSYTDPPLLTNVKENPDPLKRPENKILLLSGPAGLGKTTLAHVVAKHAKYNVIEVNASDDRSGEAVVAKIQHALESKSIRTGKPNLVIIDEIDGAAGGDNSIIKMLVELALSSSKITEGDGKDDDVPRTVNEPLKKKKKSKILNRPIICICNDVYSPVLRPLRSVSKLIQFKTPPFRILASRLSEICKWEGLLADLRTLMALCEMTDGDIRSSLNTLQFFRSRSKVLSYEMLVEANVGHKDMSRGLFRVWESIFTLPNAKVFERLGVRQGHGAGDMKRNYFKHLHSLIDACGEEERLLQGCFETYPKLKIMDAMHQGVGTSKIEKALDWLVSWDLMALRAGSSNYSAYPIIAFHYIFAKVERPTIEFPKNEYENFLATRASEGILESTVKGLGSVTRSWWGERRRLVTELLPPLIQIVTPNFYSVNVQAMRPQEKKLFERIVHIMVSFGLKYEQEVLENGLYHYRIEPPINKICNFGEKEVVGAQNMFPIKQLIAKEIALENIRRYEESKRNAPKTARQTKLPSNQPSNQPTELSKPVSKEPTPSLAPAPKPEIVLKLAKVKSTIPKDFFGRPVLQDVTAAKSIKQEVPLGVKFRFSEGHSNAVRTPLKMSDLFLRFNK
ncbi:hypothetical protein HDU67_000128 [Dinochytrium kinnereticum]|nr:hypothetical protein HDU67_000128 [Dinochytrium kinnereticum]